MGNTGSETRPGRSAGPGVSSELGRVREVARKDKDARFTALLHHVTPELLELVVPVTLKKDAAPGADGVTMAGLRARCARPPALGTCTSGRSRGRTGQCPSRRVYIPKADGRQRPLGIATVTS